MKALFLLVISLLAAWLSRAPLLAQTPTPASSIGAAAVRILPMPGLSLVEKNIFHYEAGRVDTVRTPQWQCTFTLQNTTRQPITITRLRGSCGCETLLLLKDGAAVPTIRLNPDEQAAVHLKVNLPGSQAGLVRKYVWIDGPETVSGQSSPLATLEVDILLVQSVSFTPPTLDFGKVEAGAGASQPLTVTFDPESVGGSDLPPLRSSSPDIQAVPVGPLQPIVAMTGTRLRQAFRVTLSPGAHAGKISGVLGFDPPKRPGDPDPLARVQLSLSGSITGELDAMPSSVFFGSLPAGTPVTRSVVLSTAAAQPGSALTVTSSAPWLRAVLDQTPTAARHHLLSILLTAQAPLGSLQGKITVAIGKTEHLDIPVIAELTQH